MAGDGAWILSDGGDLPAQRTPCCKAHNYGRPRPLSRSDDACVDACRIVVDSGRSFRKVGNAPKR